ncbi:MAG TPA: DUF2017 family protein, partial [Acidimicrobiales bacterium]
MSMGRTVRRSRDGRYHLRLSDEERALLAGLGDDLLADLEDDDDEGIQRLFPTAHHDDPVGDAEYHLRHHDELLTGRRATIAAFVQTAESDTLGEEQLQIWMTVINDIRLVVGTHLDVSEDMDDIVAPDPRAPQYALYMYLGGLLSDLIDAAFGGLP